MHKLPSGEIVPSMGMVWIEPTRLTTGVIKLMAEGDEGELISTWLNASQAEALASRLRNAAGAVRNALGGTPASPSPRSRAPAEEQP